MGNPKKYVDVYKIDNVSEMELLSEEENTVLEGIFDDYFALRQSEIFSEGDEMRVMDDFMYMLDHGRLPKSLLGRKMTELDPLLKRIKTLFKDTEKDLHALQISIVEIYKEKPERVLGNAFGLLESSKKKIKRKVYLPEITVVDRGNKNKKKKENMLFYDEEEIYKDLNQIKKNPAISKAYRDIVAQINTCIKQYKHDPDILFAQFKLLFPKIVNNIKKLSNHTIQVGLLKLFVRDNFDTLLYDHFYDIGFWWKDIVKPSELNEILAIWIMEGYVLDKDFLEEIHDMMDSDTFSRFIHDAVVSGCVTFKNIRDKDWFDANKNMNLLLFIVRYNVLSLFNLQDDTRHFVLANKLSLENKMKLYKTMAQYEPYPLVSKDLPLPSLKQLSESQKEELCDIILQYNPLNLINKAEIFFKKVDISSRTKEKIQKKIKQLDNTYISKIKLQIKNLKQKYNIDIIYDDSSVIYWYDEVEGYMQLSIALDTLEKSLFYYPSFIWEGKKVIIAINTDTGWGYLGMTPSEKKIIFNISFDNETVHHEVFHAKDRETGSFGWRKIFFKNAPKNYKQKSHKSIIGWLEEYQAVMGEDLFTKSLFTFVPKEYLDYFLDENGQLLQAEDRNNTYLLPKEIMKKVLSMHQGGEKNDKKEKKTEKTEEEKKEGIQNIYAELRVKEILAGAKIGYIKSDTNTIIPSYYSVDEKGYILDADGKKILGFTKPIEDRSEYGREKKQFNNSGGPDFRAKWMHGKVNPSQRVKFFNSIQLGTFNGWRKNDDGMREIIESGKSID